MTRFNSQHRKTCSLCVRRAADRTSLIVGQGARTIRYLVRILEGRREMDLLCTALSSQFVDI